MKGDGSYITNLFITEVCNVLNLSEADLRKRFCGACYDGQYLHLNVATHISEKLDLPLPFVQESVKHDPAHRVELAANDVKKRGKDRNGSIKVPAKKWLI